MLAVLADLADSMMHAPPLPFGIVAVAVAAASCSSSGSDTSCDVRTDLDCCPGQGGPEMVRLPEGYCIDSTEVTRGQYSAWLETRPSLADQPAECDNDTYLPNAECMASDLVCQDDCDDHPQVCVDWCDALAFCKAVGKRLCGRIGGGPNDFERLDAAAESQWHAACTNGGTTRLPYGGLVEDQSCNGGVYSIADDGMPGTVPVGTVAGCHGSGAYEEVHDMSGNAREWEDSCRESDGPVWNWQCRVRGGSFLETGSRLECGAGSVSGARDSDRQEDVGFRCCAP